MLQPCLRKMFSCSVCDLLPPSQLGLGPQGGCQKHQGWAWWWLGDGLNSRDFSPALPLLTHIRDRVHQATLSQDFHRDSSSLAPSPFFRSCMHPFVLACRSRLGRWGAARWVGRGDQEGTVLNAHVSLAPVCSMVAPSGIWPSLVHGTKGASGIGCDSKSSRGRNHPGLCLSFPTCIGR